MLSVTTYDQAYIDTCRSKIDAQIAAYRQVARATGTSAPAKKALASLEPAYFNALVLVLDMYFCHRARGMEGKDGNPMNEVRVLCLSLMEAENVLLADKSIKLKPDTSVLGLAVGDPISLTEKSFVALAKAYFDAIERTYT